MFWTLENFPNLNCQIEEAVLANFFLGNHYGWVRALHTSGLEFALILHSHFANAYFLFYLSSGVSPEMGEIK